MTTEEQIQAIDHFIFMWDLTEKIDRSLLSEIRAIWMAFCDREVLPQWDMHELKVALAKKLRIEKAVLANTPVIEDPKDDLQF